MSYLSSTCTFTSSYAEGYDAAKTPWILSDSNVRLFRFVHRSHGDKTNRDVKISLANITKNTDSTIYSTFDILIRAWNDTDKNPSIIEQYTGVSLDPDSANFIGRVIGNKYSDYDTTLQRILEHDDYANKSNYIRVEMDGGVANGSTTPNLIPAGFEAVYETVAGFVGFSLPSASLIYSNTGSHTFSGFNYTNSDNLNYLNPIPSEAGTGSNAAFTKTTNENKFTVPFQGGLDGTNYAVIKKIGSAIKADGTNVFGFDLSTGTSAGTAGYEKAIDILSNPEEHQFDLLVLPGVIEQYHSAVTAYAQAMVESRADCVYIRDLAGVNESVATAVSTAEGLDSSYSATYLGDSSSVSQTVLISLVHQYVDGASDVHSVCHPDKSHQPHLPETLQIFPNLSFQYG